MINLSTLTFHIVFLWFSCSVFSFQAHSFSSRSKSSPNRHIYDKLNPRILASPNHHDRSENCHGVMIPRKTFFQQILTSGSFVVSSSLTPQAVEARGLVQFPCEAPLFNTYHLMCAGESLLEEGDILTTNPLFLTNREAALSPKGISQVQETCHMLEENNVNPSIIKYSLAASAMDTTSIVKDALKVGQNRIIPEFTFMDPRAIGKWDMMSASETKAAVIALDELEAGTDGRGGRPPPNEDGTPNETLQDQSVRLVQLISVLETQFQGDTILLIFPDSTSPALLSCMMGGIPFEKVHEIEFQPGEVRLDVTMDRAFEFYQQQLLKQNKMVEYQSTLERGKVELKRLRSLNVEEIVSKKDLMIEKDRLEIEEQQRINNEERSMEEERQQQSRIRRQKELEEGREKQRQHRLQRQQEIELQRQKQLEGQVTQNTLRHGNKKDDNGIMVAVGGISSVTVVAALAFGGTKEEESATRTRMDSNADLDRNKILEENFNGTSTSATNSTRNLQMDRSKESKDLDSSINSTNTMNGTSLYQTNNESTTTMPSSLPEIILPPIGNDLLSTPPSEDERKKTAQNAMEDYMNQDDGGEDWLLAMGELIIEEDWEIIPSTEEEINGDDIT